jgi:hypothetical protein
LILKIKLSAPSNGRVKLVIFTKTSSSNSTASIDNGRAALDEEVKKQSAKVLPYS